MTETLKAWQCIGCGRIEAPQTCIGICQDRKVEFVCAADHAQVAAALAEAVRERDALAGLLRRLVHTTPRDGEWERALERFQAEARELFAAPRREDSVGSVSA
ncbi:MAG TPA: hypothetical protein VN707_06790 [Casimicrobiaceae bacterium]|nr:hypothetical protein [Casimicrobiaceae bacterium]